jgi:hypothetical protein
VEQKEIGLSQFLNIAGLKIKVSWTLGWRDDIDHTHVVIPNSFHNGGYEGRAGDHLQFASVFVRTTDDKGGENETQNCRGHQQNAGLLHC